MQICHLPDWLGMSVPIGSTALAAVQSTVMEVLYPQGIPTSGADSNVDGSALLTNMPPSASTCRRYTHLQNGGFAAGGTPIYTWLLAPVDPIGKLIVFCGGHSGYNLAGAWDLIPTQVVMIETALAAGLHVLVAEMPQTGYNPNPATVILQNGTPIEILYHWLALFDSYPDPNGMRLFLDYQIRGLNQALTDNPTLEFAGLTAFSGGGQISQIWQIVDPRVRVRYNIAGYWPRYLVGWIPTNEDWEFLYYPILRTAIGGDPDILEPVSAYGGKRVVEVFLDNDVIGPSRGRRVILDQLLDRYAIQLHNCTGSIIEHWHDTHATSHEISQWAADSVVSDILAH